MEEYARDGAVSTELEPARYVVFVRRDPSRWVTLRAVTWGSAREYGARQLRKARESLDWSDMWALVAYDGETDKHALQRGVMHCKEQDDARSKRGRTGGKTVAASGAAPSRRANAR